MKYPRPALRYYIDNVGDVVRVPQDRRWRILYLPVGSYNYLFYDSGYAHKWRSYHTNVLKLGDLVDDELEPVARLYLRMRYPHVVW